MIDKIRPSFQSLQKNVKPNRQQYEEDLKKNKYGVIGLATGAIIGIPTFLLCKKFRIESGIIGFGSLVCLMLSPLFKIDKTKYDLSDNKMDEVA